MHFQWLISFWIRHFLGKSFGTSLTGFTDNDVHVSFWGQCYLLVATQWHGPFKTHGTKILALRYFMCTDIEDQQKLPMKPQTDDNRNVRFEVGAITLFLTAIEMCNSVPVRCYLAAGLSLMQVKNRCPFFVACSYCLFVFVFLLPTTLCTVGKTKCYWHITVATFLTTFCYVLVVFWLPGNYKCCELVGKSTCKIC